MNTEDKKRLWFCSDYGIEFESVIKKLNKNGEEICIVSHDKQKNWRDISDENKEKARVAEENGYEIYGVGLNGILTGAVVKNLYHNTGVSTLEQVNEIVGDRLTLDEQFISAYALGGAEQMVQLSEKMKMNQKDTNTVIENVLFRNRRAIGIPLEKEAETLKQIQSSGKGKSDYEILVNLDQSLQPHNDEFVRI